MFWLRTLFLGAAVVLCGTPTHAQERGSDLVLECERPPEQGGVTCVSYLRGVWDGANALSTIKGIAIICANAGPVTADQMRRVFINWANRNPNYLSYPAGYTALASFIEAFPCTKK